MVHEFDKPRPRVWPRPRKPHFLQPVAPAQTVELVEAWFVEAQSAVVEYDLPTEIVVALEVTIVEAAEPEAAAVVVVVVVVNEEAALLDIPPPADDPFTSDSLHLNSCLIWPSLCASFDANDDDSDDDDDFDILDNTPTRRSSRGAALIRPSLGAALESDDDAAWTTWEMAMEEKPVLVPCTPADVLEAKQEAGLVPIRLGSVGRNPIKRTRPAMVALVNAALWPVDEFDEDDLTFVLESVDVDAAEEEEDEATFDWAPKDEAAFDWSPKEQDEASFDWSPKEEEDEAAFDRATATAELEKELSASLAPATLIRKPRTARFTRNQPSMLAMSSLMLDNVDEADEMEETCVAEDGVSSDTAEVDGCDSVDCIPVEPIAAVESEVETVAVLSSAVVEGGEVSASIASSPAASASFKRKVKVRPSLLLSARLLPMLIIACLARTQVFLEGLAVRKPHSPSSSPTACEAIAFNDKGNDDDDDDDDKEAESFGGRWCAAAAVDASSTSTPPGHNLSTPSFRSFSSGSATSTVSTNSSDDRALCTPPPTMAAGVVRLYFDDS